MTDENAMPDAPTQPSFVLRSRLISLGMMLGWCMMLGRLIHLQGAQRVLMNDQVARQSTFRQTVPARPGEILDRNGNVLAMTVIRDSLYCVPREIDDPTSFVWELSRALPINADELHRRIVDNAAKQFVWVSRRLPEEQADRVRALGLPPRTWGFRREYLRQYPQGSTAAHVLGIRDIDNHGHGGLEESLDDLIRGRDGSRAMTRDARGIVVEVDGYLSTTPQHGRTVVCALDLLTQIHAEKLLADLVERWRPVGATAVVMEPHTGEILAMASAPDFDPNKPGDVPDNAWRNLAISAVFEPGSTFKPFVVAWALEHRRLKTDEVIPCYNGAYRMGQRILHDHHAYTRLSVEDILVKSSNIGMAQIGERLGTEDLHRATAVFGFGARTGIELPGEISGLVRPLRTWDDYSIGSVPMGHELAVTPIQLITAHAALANGGRLVRPHLLLAGDAELPNPVPLSVIETVDATPNIESRIVSADVADWLVRQPMKQVVERGTGKAARIGGYSVFGKTGTAQKPDPETGGYSDTRHICSFICGAPAENPRVLVLVVVDEPTASGSHYGGTVAAPMASALLKYTLERLPRMSGRTTVRPEHDLPANRL